MVYNHTENLIKGIMEYIIEANRLLMRLRRFNKEIEALERYGIDNNQINNRLVTIGGNIKEEVLELESKMDSAYNMIELYHICDLISDTDVSCCRCNLDNVILKCKNESAKTISLIRGKVPDWEKQNYLNSWR